MNEVVRKWLVKAERDKGSARLELEATPSPNFDASCFHAQQCVEKLMKAVLIAAGAEAPKTHDLVFLAALVARIYPSWSWQREGLEALTRGAVRFRYPEEDAMRPDAEQAVVLCEALAPTLRALLEAPPYEST